MPRFPSGRGWRQCLQDPRPLRSAKPERDTYTTEEIRSIDQGRTPTHLILETQGITSRSTRFPHRCANTPLASVSLTCTSISAHSESGLEGKAGGCSEASRALSSYQTSYSGVVLPHGRTTGPHTSRHCQAVVGAGPEDQCQCGYTLQSG